MRTNPRFAGLLLTLSGLVLAAQIESSAVDRWRRALVATQGPGDAEASAGALTHISGGFGRVISGLINSVGGIVPLRGLASLAVDMGLPGAAYLLEILTPRSGAMLGSYRTSVGRETGVDNGGENAVPTVEAGPARSGITTRSDVVAYSPFKAEIQSIVGAVHGHRDCLLKLACLTGKRLSALSGASAATIMLSTATDVMPEAMKGPFSALRNSVMYSDDCSQYVCSKYPDRPPDRVG